MFKKIVLSSDHGGFNLKEKVKDFLIKQNFQVEDVGCNSLDASRLSRLCKNFVR